MLFGAAWLGPTTKVVVELIVLVTMDVEVVGVPFEVVTIVLVVVVVDVATEVNVEVDEPPMFNIEVGSRLIDSGVFIVVPTAGQ